MSNLKTKFEAEPIVMREKLVAAELVYEADKKTIHKTMEAKILEA